MYNESQDTVQYFNFARVLKVIAKMPLASPCSEPALRSISEPSASIPAVCLVHRRTFGLGQDLVPERNCKSSPGAAESHTDLTASRCGLLGAGEGKGFAIVEAKH
jgi:hypothetical protein